MDACMDIVEQYRAMHLDQRCIHGHSGLEFRMGVGVPIFLTIQLPDYLTVPSPTRERERERESIGFSHRKTRSVLLCSREH